MQTYNKNKPKRNKKTKTHTKPNKTKQSKLIRASLVSTVFLTRKLLEVYKTWVPLYHPQPDLRCPSSLLAKVQYQVNQWPIWGNFQQMTFYLLLRLRSSCYHATTLAIPQLLNDGPFREGAIWNPAYHTTHALHCRDKHCVWIKGSATGNHYRTVLISLIRLRESKCYRAFNVMLYSTKADLKNWDIIHLLGFESQNATCCRFHFA